ncbi:response regulator [Puniceibacterium sp. IMCC21224]|uniref:response regulator n=1 Tax=Puniceibacterium sp. IMCC21224 TaxID=1618204 RepID=UPI00064DF712|nr:response regulator [Puniceibacterium sp. IMCC21224]KMK64951.1 Response regulator receiver domain protein [Puniceibacterium sp. IMCC21224]
MKLLFVDDEADIRELVEMALMTEDDIDVRFAASGAEALDIILSDAFDVIMLDVMMPPPDGLQLLRTARSRAVLNDTIIIMCTAKTSSEAEAEFRSLGANHVLHKPFKPLKLADFLRQLD